MERVSFWVDGCKLPRYGKLDRNLTVDVAVIGAGITGITTAYLLQREGKSVALLEKGEVGGVDSSYTTAHLTVVTDVQLHQLAKTFGKDHARAAWEAGNAAIDLIHANIQREKIECDFRWVSAWLHAPIDQKREVLSGLQEDLKLANEIGFQAVFADITPIVNVPGVEFRHQALFHPRKYMAGLLAAFTKAGGLVFDQTEVEQITGEAPELVCGPHKVKAGYAVCATHNPLSGKLNFLSATLLQSKLALYSTYAIGGRLEAGAAPVGSYWSLDEPYWYLRVHPAGDGLYAILGGQDHKTGQETDAEKLFAAVAKKFKELFPRIQMDHRWSGQVIETADGLPYIGEARPGQFLGTGFGGNGMTFGTLTGVMAADHLAGRKNPWVKLFDIHRKKISSAWDYLTENKDYPYYLVRDRLARAAALDENEPGVGEGKILKIDGKKVAVYKDEKGKLVKRSPVCTHMGCIVHWNTAEQTWDCPCHGSRFTPAGEVMSGPAGKPLEPIQ